MIFNITGGGGSALNFNVVAYNTEEELLAAMPPENTIGIVTDVPITSWIFSNEEPSPGINGMVWFATATYSNVEFNALKKNGIMVYPLMTKQHVAGSWVDKTAKQWQSGEWVEWWNGTLFDYGDITHATGGWTTFSIPMNITVQDDGSWFIKASKHTNGPYNTILTVNSIDLTPYKSLCFVGNGAKTYPYMGVIKKFTTEINSQSDVITSVGLSNVTGTPNNPIKIDISLINEECHICFYSFSSSIGEITMQQLWLE